jgi:hypothetical protein
MVYRKKPNAAFSSVRVSGHLGEGLTSVRDHRTAGGSCRIPDELLTVAGRR